MKMFNFPSGYKSTRLNQLANSTNLTKFHFFSGIISLYHLRATKSLPHHFSQIFTHVGKSLYLITIFQTSTGKKYKWDGMNASDHIKFFILHFFEITSSLHVVKGREREGERVRERGTAEPGFFILAWMMESIE